MDLPSYLLFTEPSGFNCGHREGRPFWRFELRSEDGARLAASDCEAGASIERLALLALVRGLEALDGPSSVVLVNPHRYVSRGLDYGLPAWREQHWHWERFGQMVQIRNADLWQRVDQAMAYHRLECRLLRTDPTHAQPSGPHYRLRRVSRGRKQSYQAA